MKYPKHGPQFNSVYHRSGFNCKYTIRTLTRWQNDNAKSRRWESRVYYHTAGTHWLRRE